MNFSPTQPYKRAALLKAAESYDVTALIELFGPDGKVFVSSGGPVQDKNDAATFVSKAQEMKAVVNDPQNNSRAILSIGNED